MKSANRRAISTPRDGIPASTTSLQIRIPLDDLVRDPAQRTANRGGIHHRTAGG